MSVPARHVLELVTHPEPAEHVDSAAQLVETVVPQWSSEHQYIGSLQWLTAQQAATIVDLVPADALRDPRARWAHELIAAQIAAGTDPNPVLILRAAAQQPPADALHPDRAPGAEQVKALSLYLFDVYSAAIAPQTSVTAYASDVLDHAYRRGFARLGARMQYLAETGCTRGELTEQFTAIRDELAALWRRCETLNTNPAVQP
jgi:hypothetical protein